MLILGFAETRTERLKTAVSSSLTLRTISLDRLWNAELEKKKRK